MREPETQQVSLVKSDSGSKKRKNKNKKRKEQPPVTRGWAPRSRSSLHTWALAQRRPKKEGKNQERTYGLDAHASVDLTGVASSQSRQKSPSSKVWTAKIPTTTVQATVKQAYRKLSLSAKRKMHPPPPQKKKKKKGWAISVTRARRKEKKGKPDLQSHRNNVSTFTK